jgi:hypothetical protein
MFRALITEADKAGHCRLLLELAAVLSALGEDKAAKNTWMLAARQAFAQPPLQGLFWLREVTRGLFAGECFSEIESIVRDLEDWQQGRLQRLADQPAESILALKSELLAELSMRLAADRGEDEQADAAWARSLAIARNLTDPILRAAALRFAATKVFP